MAIGTGHRESAVGLIEGYVLHRSGLVAQRSHALVFGIDEVHGEFAVLVSNQAGLSKPWTYSLPTAIQFPSELRATSRTGSVVRTNISSNLAFSSENRLTVPSSEPVMKKPFYAGD